jgi:L-amino acid N-acyltransferase YncA
MDSDRYRRLAAAALAHVPAPVRPTLHWMRDRVQLADSALRRRLPEELGGRYSDQAVQCRRVGLEDLDALRGLRQGTEPMSRETRAQASDLDSATQFCVGVYVNGHMVGCGWCVSVGEAAGRPYRDALLLSDFVQPSFRRRGLAQRLHDARLAQMAALRTETAFAWVDSRNGASLAVFEAKGFSVVPQARGPRWLEPPSPHHLLLSRAVSSQARAQPDQPR